MCSVGRLGYPGYNGIFGMSRTSCTTVINRIGGTRFGRRMRQHVGRLRGRRGTRRGTRALGTRRGCRGLLSRGRLGLARGSTRVTGLRDRLRNVRGAGRLDLTGRVTGGSGRVTTLRARLSSGRDGLGITVLRRRGGDGSFLRGGRRRVRGLGKSVRLTRGRTVVGRGGLGRSFRDQLGLGRRRMSRCGRLGTRVSAGVVKRDLRIRYDARFGEMEDVVCPYTCFRGSGSTDNNDGKSFVFQSATSNMRCVSVVFRVGGRVRAATAGRGGRSFFTGLSGSEGRGNYRCTILISLLRPGDRLCGRNVISISCGCPGVCMVHPRFFVPLVSLLARTSGGDVRCRGRLVLTHRRDISIAGFRGGIGTFHSGFTNRCRGTDRGFGGTVRRVSGAVGSLRGVGSGLLDSRGCLHLTGGSARSLDVGGLAHNGRAVGRGFRRTEEVSRASARLNWRGDRAGGT